MSSAELELDDELLLEEVLEPSVEDEPSVGGGPGGGPLAPPGPPGPPEPPAPPGPFAKAAWKTPCSSVAWLLVSLPLETSPEIRLLIFVCRSPGDGRVPLD